nr:uncharacterized protein LOC109169767 [Ipomoea batatas]
MTARTDGEGEEQQRPATGCEGEQRRLAAMASRGDGDEGWICLSAAVIGEQLSRSLFGTNEEDDEAVRELVNLTKKMMVESTNDGAAGEAKREKRRSSLGEGFKVGESGPGCCFTPTKLETENHDFSTPKKNPDRKMDSKTKFGVWVIFILCGFAPICQRSRRPVDENWVHVWCSPKKVSKKKGKENMATIISKGFDWGKSNAEFL